jgi:enoyl-[acyl-carrier protein] reductase I
MIDFLQLAGRRIVVFGVANRKSVAYFTGKLLEDLGANVVYVVRTDQRREALAKLLPQREILVCDVEYPDQIARLGDSLAAGERLGGMVHSIAFADYGDGMRPFHETTRQQFLRSVDVSCYSLIALSNALKDQFARDASVVTISISTTSMASENYGYMAPIKAALDSSLAFLTKSFSRFSEVRFNAVAPGLLKTSASAGIPGYAHSFLYAEQVIPRRRAVTTDEVAQTVCFLLSPRSSGITAQRLIVDAGMSINYFDQALIERAMRD